MDMPYFFKEVEGRRVEGRRMNIFYYYLGLLSEEEEESFFLLL